jgi:hypothetical protein
MKWKKEGLSKKTEILISVFLVFKYYFFRILILKKNYEKNNFEFCFDFWGVSWWK